MGRTDDLRAKFGLPPAKGQVQHDGPARYVIGATEAPSSSFTTNADNSPFAPAVLAPSPLFMALAHIGLEQMDPIKFEELVLGMFLTFGFNGHMTPPSGDHGIDIELRSKTGNVLVVQCKRYQGDQVVSPKEVREFLGALTFMKATEGYFVTTSSFSEQCRVVAQNQPLHLIDGNSLRKLLVLSETIYRQSLNERSTTGAPEEFIRRHL